MAISGAWIKDLPSFGSCGMNGTPRGPESPRRPAPDALFRAYLTDLPRSPVRSRDKPAGRAYLLAIHPGARSSAYKLARRAVQNVERRARATLDPHISIVVVHMWGYGRSTGLVCTLCTVLRVAATRGPSAVCGTSAAQSAGIVAGYP